MMSYARGRAFAICFQTERRSFLMASLWLFTYLFKLIWECIQNFFKVRASSGLAEEAVPRIVNPTEVVSTQTEVSYNSAELAHLERLSSSLVAFLKNDWLTDITIVCENQEFRAHRLILLAFCPFFQTLCSKRCEGMMSEKLEFPQISAISMTAILSFIYTGRMVNVSAHKAALDVLLRHPENVNKDTGNYEHTLKIQHNPSSPQIQLFRATTISTNKQLQEAHEFTAGRSCTDFLVKRNSLTRFIDTLISEVKIISEKKAVMIVCKTVSALTQEQGTFEVKIPCSKIITDGSFFQLNAIIVLKFSYSECKNNTGKNNFVYCNNSIQIILDSRSQASDNYQLRTVPERNNFTMVQVGFSNNNKINSHLNILKNYSSTHDFKADKEPPNSQEYCPNPQLTDTTLCNPNRFVLQNQVKDCVNTTKNINTQVKFIERGKEPANPLPYSSSSLEQHSSADGNSMIQTFKTSHPYMKHVTATNDKQAVLDRSHYTVKRKVVVKDKDKIELLHEASHLLQSDDLLYKSLANLDLTMTCFKELYDFIEQINNPYAESKIVGFLAEHFKVVSKTTDFALLKECQLKKIIQHSTVHKLFKEDVLIGILRWMAFDTKRELLLDDFLTILDLHVCSECLNDVVNDIVTLKVNGGRHESLNVGLLVARMISMKMSKENGQNDQKLCFLDYNEEMKQITTVLYDCEKNQLLTIKELPGQIYHGGLAVAAYGSHIYYFGINAGTKGTLTSTRVLSYCPITNCVEELNSGLVYPVSYAGVGVLDDVFYVVNGLGKRYGISKTVQRFNPIYRTCIPLASTNNGHIRPHVLPFNDSLYVVGSWGTTDNFLEQYSLLRDQWTILTHVPSYIAGCYAALSNPRLFVLGRQPGTNFHVYNLLLDNWVVLELSGGPTVVSGLWSITRKDETVLVVRGDRSIYSYSVESKRWENLSLKVKYL